MNELRNQIRSCNRCPLCTEMPGENKPTPGDGPYTAKMMFVGEALGQTEAMLELPFQGRSGQLLNKMLDDAKIKREEIYITNVVKCWPTLTKGVMRVNRTPTPEEQAACKIWLWKEIQLVKPRIIITLGKVPTYTLLNRVLKPSFLMKNVIGGPTNMKYGDVATIVIPSYHPSYLLQHGREQIGKTTSIFKYARTLV